MPTSYKVKLKDGSKKYFTEIGQARLYLQENKASFFSFSIKNKEFPGQNASSSLTINTSVNVMGEDVLPSVSPR